MPAPIEPDLLTEPETLSPRDQLIREIIDEIDGIEAEYKRLNERADYWRAVASKAGLTHAEFQDLSRSRWKIEHRMYEP